MGSFKYFFFLILLFTSSIYSQYFWTEQESGTNVILNSVSNIDGTNAWVCGYNGTVLKTSNSGYNWNNVSGNGIPSNILLVTIYGISNTTAVVAGYLNSNSYMYRTSNSGANWQLVFSEDGGFINGIYMQNSSNGFMYGDYITNRWSLWKTTNGGVNWDSTGLYLPVIGNELGWGNSIWGVNSKVWFGTDKFRIYHTADFMNPVWQIQMSPTDTNIYSLWFNSSGTTGFFGGDSLSKSTNGGNNWNVVPSFGIGNISAFTGLDGVQSYWYVRSNNIYFSQAGSPFGIQYTAPEGGFTELSAARSYFIGGPGAIYGVRTNGGISRLNFFVEGVTIISNEIPAAYKLHQNYPNPFNATTVFKFEAPKLSSSVGGEVRGGYVRLITYNALGQETGSLVNEVLQPGIYKVEWNGNDLASGIYFYRLLVTDPNSGSIVHSDSKKMVMIK